MAKTAKKFTTDDAAAEVISAFEKFIQTLAAQGGGKVSASEPDEDVEEYDEEEDESEEMEAPDRETVESLGIKELRTLAKEYGIEDTKKADILAAFEDLYDEEDEEDEDEDEDEDEADEDEEEEDEWDRESLEELDLKDLRKVARDEGHTAAEYKGMDQDAIIDLILGEESDEDEEDEDEEGDEEVDEIDEDDLKAMSHKELLTLAKELEVKVPAALKKDTKVNHKKLVALILDEGEED